MIEFPPTRRFPAASSTRFAVMIGLRNGGFNR
jgi:hypothetical protein